MTNHPKEHGLLFKPEMVRAYLAGRKSMTRRVITRQNSYIDAGPAYKKIWDELQFDKAWIDAGPSLAGNEGPYLKVPRVEKENGKVIDEYVHRIYPKFQVGDTIWGRETWYSDWDGENPFRWVHYRADDICRQECNGKPIMEPWFRSSHEGPWKSPLHMPRWASRIVTPIVAVRPERVQEICDADCEAEGIEAPWQEAPEGDGGWYHWNWAFKELWNSINAPRGFGWAANPFVWAITFKRREGN